MPSHAVKLYIDSCAINVICENKVSLLDEFSRERYELIITKGVRQEIQDIPDSEEKKFVKSCALSIIEEQYISEESFFGFCDIKNPENNLRYIGGFDEGAFATDKQISFLEETQKNLGPPRKSKLRKNETDRDFLALGLGAVVLTAENKVGGALKSVAEKRGTIIVNIANWPCGEMSLNEYVDLEIEKIFKTQIQSQ